MLGMRFFDTILAGKSCRTDHGTGKRPRSLQEKEKPDGRGSRRMIKRDFAVKLAAIVLLSSSAVQAGDPPPFPEFTFKRITAPKPGSTPRITVQIEPKAEAPVLENAPALPVGDGTDNSFAWYWDAISPDISASGPGRLPNAVLQLAKGPGVPTPRLQDLQEIAKQHGIEILKATIGTRVSPALALAVMGIESSGMADAVSTAGARGLMQLMPDTAQRFGVSDSADPAQNIRGGVAYLDWLMGEFDADPILVLAGYNAGEGAVREYAGVPPFAETRAYVPKVLAAWSVARGLCLTPPELISDGCVFAVQGLHTDG